MWQDFKKFALKGNVVDMAVGVIVGGAFGKIVTSLVNDVIMPILGLLVGRIDLSSLKLVLRQGSDTAAELSLTYGAFLQNVLDFLIISFSIFMRL
jgi:large conductance mechanosensitive channel